LRQAITEKFPATRIHQWVKLPAVAGRLRARLFEAGAVLHEDTDEEGWSLELDLTERLAAQLCVGGDVGAQALRGQLQAGLQARAEQTETID
jgi:GTP-binding protein HflX